ncbi:MAG: glycoside hydrolase family 2 TIM barrel-domain containing protein [Propionibacteriaceae bacterium]|nr:glycoside hydrolase family 2 TIM barrel-domain containing protein [Propionibacteriaceae bacterium]
MIDTDRLADPRFVAEHALPPRSDHRWFASYEEAELGHSSFERSLNGLWKFHCAPSLAARPAGFEAPGFDVDGWQDIPVPAHIQLHGHSRPQYVNMQYPWDGHDAIWPGELPRRNPVASYITWFDQAPLAAGERLVVRFDGVESALAVWLNGHWIGYATDSFTPTEFDLTEAIVAGENRLAVQVFTYSSGSWLEDQDYYRFSGIFRDVTLLTVPATHLADLRVTTQVAPGEDVANVGLAATLTGPGTVRARLEGVGELVGGAITVAQPRLWSAEAPHLYRLLIDVLDAAGQVVEVVVQRVGIRRFGIEDGLLRINGRRVVFRGVNRHEFGLRGRVMTRDEIRADLHLLKASNVNAIRTSHYPNSTAFYELCDELGFYVIDEMNLETHGVMDAVHKGRLPLTDMVPGDRPEWRPAVLHRAANLLRRDVNHPSVVMWSCGNESLGGENLLAVADYFRAQDSRPVHYEGTYADPRHPETSDVYSRMYAPAAEIEEYLAQHRDKPYILCEYAHAMGNSLGAVAKYTELAYREPLFQGGFIWDFADQAIAMTDAQGREFFGYGGDCQEAPSDYDFSANGLLFADHTPKPLLAEAKYHYRGLNVRVARDSFTVDNRHLFTDAAAFDCIAVLARDGVELTTGHVAVAVGPEASARFPLPFALPDAPGEYAVTVSFRLREATAWALAGHEVAFGQGVFRVGELVAPPTPVRPELIDGIENIGVRGRYFHALFSKTHGGLTSYRFGHGATGPREWLRGQPRPCFWHAPTSNERGWGMPERDGAWLLASRYARAVSHRVAWEDDRVAVTFDYQLPGGGLCTVGYAIDGAGRVDIDMRLEPAADWPDPPEFGLLIPVDPDLQQLTWYGYGPHENYLDRRDGAKLGLWRGRVAEQLTPYIRPQEAGSHAGVRWATITNREGRGLRIASTTELEFSALPWSPFEIENAAHPVDLPPSRSTILRPALRRRGVGGDDSWGAMTHPEYRLPTGPLRFRFTLQGV